MSNGNISASWMLFNMASSTSAVLAVAGYPILAGAAFGVFLGGLKGGMQSMTENNPSLLWKNAGAGLAFGLLGHLTAKALMAGGLGVGMAFFMTVGLMATGSGLLFNHIDDNEPLARQFSLVFTQRRFAPNPVAYVPVGQPRFGID